MAWFHVLRSETGSNEAPQTQRGFSFQSTGEPGSRAELIFYVFRAAMLALIAWAVAAGSERSWQLATSSESSSVLVGWSRVSILLGATIFYVLGALGTIALIMLAAGLIGGLFGFLFGTPRLESARSQALLTSPSVSTTAAAGPAGEAPATVTGPQQQQLVQQTASARGGFQMSPALTEIADWLTKIIVGLGLVQAGPISAGFGSIVQWLLRDAKLDQFFAAGAVIPAAILVGLIGGFMFGYLLMALFIGRELAHAAIDMETLQNRAYEEGERRGTIMARQKEVTYLDAVSALRGKDIDAISLGAWSEGTANMPHDVVRAAETVAVRDLDGINTPEELQAWAKAQTLLGRHRDAVKGFQKLAKIHRTADALYDLARALRRSARRMRQSASLPRQNNWYPPPTQRPAHKLDWQPSRKRLVGCCTRPRHSRIYF